METFSVNEILIKSIFDICQLIKKIMVLKLEMFVKNQLYTTDLTHVSKKNVTTLRLNMELSFQLLTCNYSIFILF